MLQAPTGYRRMPTTLFKRWWLIAIALYATPADATTRNVTSTAEFATALAAAQPGDTISLRPGVYNGGHFRAGLTDVTIRGATGDPHAPEEIVFRGGVNGIQLSDASGVTLEGLTFEQQSGNGINIDDGGTFATPSTNITLRNVTVRDMAASGNNDGVKLSGVTGFLLDRVKVFNWGASGSAIDPVGSHNGVIQNSHFRSVTLTDNGSGVRPKGGRKNISVRSSLFELPAGAGRALQAGGSTGSEFFRFIDGDSGYEADEITFVGNRVIGGSSSMNWVNIDGGVARYNDFRQPSRWAMRILNENPGATIIDTSNGVFTDNYVEYDGAAWSQAVNVGSEVNASSFTFARNKWRNTANPTSTGSIVTLPVPETDGEYGVGAPWGVGFAMRWELDWGVWVVGVDADSATTAAFTVPHFREYLIAAKADGSEFDPLSNDPLSGDWLVRPAELGLEVGAFRDFVLIRPEDCSICSTLSGDYDRSGVVDPGDRLLWAESYGYTGDAPLADGNGDGVVDAADYTVWRDAYAASLATAAVPEPTSATLLLFGLAWRQMRRRRG
ncbi:hypothetical protein Pla108_08000 [Botrimarina colliarenosi]|uniref:Probable pectate lyase C n=1 Tax=Botrimarina colliarenosi TaxID=2528001 RepID=A0A5C6AK29_9BACT|nr:right-handed parallel beta-helix repeat-containing protein [Botrimarina colliarenosi]TWT99857.1 hypothetical protein Pla108_08000 [Botrimarina colliarenosi]